MTTAVLALAFGAGLLAPVNPCGFAVLPAFLAYAIGTDTRPTDAPRQAVATRLAGGLRAGIALTVGFTGTFTLLGVLLAIGMRSLISVVPWAAALLGGALAVAGVAMLAGWRIPLRLSARGSGSPRQGPIGMITFGAGYALASASCTLALLLSVVTQALAGPNLTGVLVVFAAYAAGSATLLLTLALFAAFASSVISRFLRRLLPHMNRIMGAVLALSGGYLLLYWLPQLLGDGGPGSSALTGPVGAIAVWLSQHQGLVAVTALTLVAATTITTLALHRRALRPAPARASDEDCCVPLAGEPEGSAGEIADSQRRR
jgi:cytochrome c-type biogenesis protein